MGHLINLVSIPDNCHMYSCLENSMDKPGGLQSVGLQRVGHSWATNTLLKNIYELFTISQSASVTGQTGHTQPVKYSPLELTETAYLGW